MRADRTHAGDHAGLEFATPEPLLHLATDRFPAFTDARMDPAIGDDLNVAMHMVQACLSPHQDQAFVIDTPDYNEGWIRFLETTGFRPQRPFIRMHRGRPGPFGVLRHQFAVLGPEFG